MAGIFRAYDIRGTYPDQLNEGIAERIGKAFGTLMTGTLAVGRDARTSSPGLQEAVIRGLLTTGARVIDIGEVPTPLLYFAVAHWKLAGGLMVTASHNPGAYNGIKPCGPGGVCWSYESGGNRIEALVQSRAFASRPNGRLEQKDVFPDYLEHCKRNIRFAKPLRIVIDAGNGTTWKTAPALFRALGSDVVELFCTPDGSFPNHIADPLQKHTLRALQEAVPRERADLGIAFDADGDRVGFVNPDGSLVEGNLAFALFAKKALAKNPGSKILIEILSSQMVDDVIKAAGGTTVVCPVGHTYVQETMARERCILAGETSMHYYFPENYSYDDGLFAGLRFCELVANNERAALAEGIPHYLTSDDTRLPCPDDKKFAAVAHLKQKFAAGGHKMVTLDGVKVYPRSPGIAEGSWFIVRPSNTSPVLVLRWEAKDPQSFAAVEKLAKAAFEEACQAVGAPVPASAAH
ncbi:MAG TPA: phosphomannomutase/phosphoglucomutase [archaeon]|nr:phosphomannomutase/phosphoglucomutase [archaeon]